MLVAFPMEIEYSAVRTNKTRVQACCSRGIAIWFLMFALSLADRRFAVHKADFSEWVRRIRKRAFLWARKRLEKTPAIAIKAENP